MNVLNFSHPFTIDQMDGVRNNLPTFRDFELIEIPKVHFDVANDLVPQIEALVDGLHIPAERFQTESWAINLPALSSAAAILLVELHGRMGNYPALIRLKMADSVAAYYEVAEIINLNSVRSISRTKR